MAAEQRRALAPGAMDPRRALTGSKEKVEEKGSEIPVEDQPKPRRKTVMRLMAQGDRAEKKEQAERQVKEEQQPICKIIPMKVAIRLKDITSSLAKELPQDITEIRMARLRAPKSSTGAVLRDGATVSQAATHAAIKALEQWVRILRPFASEEENLAVLIARIVHVKDDGSWKEMEGDVLEVIPAANEPLGAALRRIVPDPDLVRYKEWEWLEDFQRALAHEEMFDRNSFVHRSSTPSGMRQTGAALMSQPPRPKTTGRIPGKRPASEATRIRLSGDFPWAGFQPNNGFRATTTTGISPKYLRSLPGPALYSDYDKHLSLPVNAARGVYPSVGDRRTPCITLPLAQLDRFFFQDFRLE